MVKENWGNANLKDAKLGFSSKDMASDPSFFKGKEAELNKEELAKWGNQMSGATTQMDPQGQPMNIQPTPNGFLAETVPTMEVSLPPEDTGADITLVEPDPPTVLTNALNVEVTKDSVCGDSAGSIQVGAQFQGNVNDFCIRGRTVDVKHADEVLVKCGGNGATWQAKDIKDAKISLGMYVQFNTSTDQTVDVRDCNENTMQVTFKGENSKAEFEKDGQEVHLQSADVLLNINDGSFITQEIAQANGSASLVFDKATGLVQFVDMQPTFSYEFRTGDIRKDFAFKAEGGKHLLWIHRKPDEPVRPEALSCIFCSFVNMPERVIQVKSDVAYQRKWWRMSGGVGAQAGGSPILVSDANVDNGYVTVLKGKENKAVSIVKLDKDFIFIDDLYVKVNAPPLYAAFSNYLNVTELSVPDEDAAGNRVMATHRLLGIDDKIIDKDNLAVSIVKNYRTSYSQATMSIDDNNVIYKRNSLNVDVLAPFNPLVSKKLTDLFNLNTALAAVIASVFMLIPGFFVSRRLFSSAKRSKKGQLTVFILVGLLMLFLVALMLLLVSGGMRLKQADEAGINGFLQDCMRMEARDSLKFIGTQGGAETAPLTRWYDKRMTPLPVSAIEGNLARDLQKRMTLCLNEIRGNFKGIDAIGRADPKVETAITQATVVFKLNYPLPVTLKDGTTFIVSDKTVTEPNKLMQIIGLTLATTMSETQYDGLIDLDALKTHDATMTFFPNNGELVAFARDDGYFINLYEFAFSNRR